MPADYPKSSLPVAEATYPPPGPSLLTPGLVFALGAGLVAFVLVGLGVARAIGAQQQQVTRTGSAAPEPPFAGLAYAYYERAFLQVGGAALTDRYVDVALLRAAPQLDTRPRPAGAGANAPVRIVAATRRAVSVAVTRASPRELLMVAYETTADAGLPTTRGAPAALSYLESGYRTYPDDAVVLLVWGDTAVGIAGRVYAVDFVMDEQTAVAVTAVDPDVLQGSAAVAFALGDPLGGGGRLISPWFSLPEQL